MKEISLLREALYQKHFLELLFLFFRPHQQYQAEKEESEAAKPEIFVTFAKQPEIP